MCAGVILCPWFEVGNGGGLWEVASQAVARVFGVKMGTDGLLCGAEVIGMLSGNRGGGRSCAPREKGFGDLGILVIDVP